MILYKITVNVNTVNFEIIFDKTILSHLLIEYDITPK